MPVFFQQQINEQTRLGIWKIEETEDFFKENVPQHRDVTHPRKRLQHLAGRFLLRYLFPDFTYHLIEIADTRKPFLREAQYQFSISHCGNFAAAIVSADKRVGIDIEIPVGKIIRIGDKYLSDTEKEIFSTTKNISDSGLFTLIWSAKESVFKWYGDGEVDFKKHIQLSNLQKETIDCYFAKTGSSLTIFHINFNQLILCWVMS